MNQETLERRLAGLPLGNIRFFNRLGSTNDVAIKWAENGAPDLSLVVADEQTAGRGRAGRTWVTSPGTALALSLILRPSQDEIGALSRTTALGALAVCIALLEQYSLSALIKWPNDVLLNYRKVAGVLVEADWKGEQCPVAVLGIGINVATRSVVEAERQEKYLRYPAISVEEAADRPIDRLDLLCAVIRQVISWRKQIRTASFLQAWESSLAFRGEWVQLVTSEKTKEGQPEDPATLTEGQVLGLEPDGGLKLQTRSGEIIVARAGDLRLRPASE
jgi:BirA family transcriptional regulator, biotin operon repressor / biotin---[acetyl-CoA-carboxylase] ligase